MLACRLNELQHVTVELPVVTVHLSDCYVGM